MRSSNRFRVTFEANRYSVPAEYALQRLTLKAYPDRISIYLDGRVSRTRRTAKRNGGYTDALSNDLRDMRTAAVRREYQGVYASDAIKASEVMKLLDLVSAVDLGSLAEEDAAASFRTYRALPVEDRLSVLANAVASLTVPHLGDDNDVSAAHEEAVRELDFDFPAELAAIGAQPFDADLVWNRMNKALILGVDASAARRLPTGFAPVQDDAEAPPEDVPEVATELKLITSGLRIASQPHMPLWKSTSDF